MQNKVSPSHGWFWQAHKAQQTKVSRRQPLSLIHTLFIDAPSDPRIPGDREERAGKAKGVCVGNKEGGMRVQGMSFLGEATHTIT